MIGAMRKHDTGGSCVSHSVRQGRFNVGFWQAYPPLGCPTVKPLPLLNPSNLEHRVHSPSVTFDGRPASFRTWHTTDSHHPTRYSAPLLSSHTMHPTPTWRYVGMSVVENVSLMEACAASPFTLHQRLHTAHQHTSCPVDAFFKQERTVGIWARKAKKMYHFSRPRLKDGWAGSVNATLMYRVQ